MADLHAKQAGVVASGATVAICLVKVSEEVIFFIICAGFTSSIMFCCRKADIYFLLSLSIVFLLAYHHHHHSISQYLDQSTSCHGRRVVQLTAANAGDSRVVLCQAPESGCHPRAERLSIDHRPDDPREVQRIEQAGGFCVKGRVLGMLAVSRSLGDQVLKPFVIGEPHVCEREVVLHKNSDDDNNNNNIGQQRRSFIIVACDGLFDVMSDQEACDLVYAYKGERNEVAQVLVQEALRRGTTDNLTVVVSYL
jgi:serine/threonine protein phosphatase PrpC